MRIVSIANLNDTALANVFPSINYNVVY